MCGRYTLTSTPGELVETFDVPGPTFDFAPSFNIAPGREVPVLAEDGAGRRLGLLSWGLVPTGGAPGGRRFVNARSETVARTPAFRKSFAARRCLVPADGFYEWKRDAGGKVPYWFHKPGRGLFTMAGVWDRWPGPDGGIRHGFAILTRAAGREVLPVHQREPLVIGEDGRDDWLTRSTSDERLRELMGASASWAFHTVDRRVGSPAADDPGLIEAV